MTADIGWRFPLNDGGMVDGFGHAGIETFMGEIYWHLARETIQNSLDAAAYPDQRPVQVSYELFDFPSRDFPGREQFADVLSRVKRRYKSGNRNEYNFFKRAIEILDQSTIPFLRIRDLNTTGVLGAKVDDPQVSQWSSLVKGSGFSTKPDDSGGSFGIGKNAPVACSGLRTVFYSTLDQEGVRAFQGVAHLAAHESRNGQMTRGTGFYGVIKDNTPLLDVERVGQTFRRAETGTDIFVAGFHAMDDCLNSLVRSVVENFFVAIHNGRLEVTVQDVEITRESLKELIHKFDPEPGGYTRSYYDALTSGDSEHHVEQDFHGLGRVQLFLREHPEYRSKRIAMTRKTGMKIYSKKTHAHVSARFRGVLIADGEGINKLLRETEPPAHNAWNPSQLVNDPELQRKAEQLKRRLYDWMNEKVRLLDSFDPEHQIEIEGVGSLLTVHESEEENLSNAPMSKGRERAGPVELAHPGAPRVKPRGQDFDDEADLGGRNGPRHDEPETPEPKERQRRPVPPAPERRQRILLRNRRIFCVDPDKGQYVVKLAPERSALATITLVVMGEDEFRPAPVVSAVDESTGKQLPVGEGGVIGPIALHTDRRTNVLVRLSEPERVALEVVVRESP